MTSLFFISGTAPLRELTDEEMIARRFEYFFCLIHIILFLFRLFAISRSYHHTHMHERTCQSPRNVTLVRDVVTAQRVVALLRAARWRDKDKRLVRMHACDTEAIDLDLKVSGSLCVRKNFRLHFNFNVKYNFDEVVKQKVFTLGEGINNFSIIEQDAAGNTRTLSLPPVTLDTVAPVILVTSIIPSLTNQSTLNVTYKLDGVDKQKSFTLNEGVNVLSLTATDLAGNTTTVNLKSVTLDTIVPIIVVNLSTPSVIDTKNITVQYTVDGIAKIKTFENLAEGNNTLSIIETDLAGNQTTRTLSVDVRAVKADFIGVTDGAVVRGVLNIGPNTVAHVGIRKVAYYLNGTRSGKVYSAPRQARN